MFRRSRPRCILTPATRNSSRASDIFLAKAMRREELLISRDRAQSPARESRSPSAMNTLGRARDEVLAYGVGHAAFAVGVIAFVLLWMSFFHVLDILVPTKSRTMVAILQTIALLTSCGGGFLAVWWLGRQPMRPSSAGSSSISAKSSSRSAPGR